MKALIFLALMLALAAVASADRVVPLGWDDQDDAAAWRVYREAEFGREFLVEVTEPAAAVTLSNAPHAVFVTAIGWQGDESEKSESLPIAEVRVLSIQMSADLLTWNLFLELPLPDDGPPRFWRWAEVRKSE